MKLGTGSHFGEWWGQGIQRNYALKEKKFSLFNVGKWNNENMNTKQNHSDNPDWPFRKGHRSRMKAARDWSVLANQVVGAETNVRPDHDALVQQLTNTITALCQAIDPTSMCGPETEKIAQMAIENREQLDACLKILLPALTYETVRAVIERMTPPERALFVTEFFKVTYDITTMEQYRDLSPGMIIAAFTAPLPTIVLCVAKAKGWEI